MIDKIKYYCLISLLLVSSIAQAEEFKVKGMHVAMISQVMTYDALLQLADHAAKK